MWTRKLIDTKRGTFEVFEKGVGEPLCVTHLYSAYDKRGNTFADPFTSDYQVFLVNLRGCGHSDKAEHEGQYSMNEAVKDLEAIRCTLRLDYWGFAGHSTGGMLALKYAIKSPAALTKLIAGGTSASKDFSEDSNSIYCKENPNYPRIVEIMNELKHPSTSVEVRKQLGLEWSKMSFFSEEKLRQSLKWPNSGKTMGARLDYFITKENPTYDVRDSLKNVSIPSFIYAGRYDAQCPFQYGVEIAHLIPNATLTVFEESNHYPYVEEPEKFQAFVKATLL
ncbi:alpha/beta fold hydrolase [Alkalihalophilus sp. As8PL]|uniref:Alpha/beta fold hydrolase n=1 Tax=Alkalihalophilus sp. As8PL TaxID=3237103 RepID=A0AB39BWR4_9BACI